MKKFLNNKKLIFGLIIIIAIGLRLYDIVGDDIWRDESFSINAANKTFSDLLYVIFNDAHPPLHLTLLHFWMKLFGDSAFSARLLSVIFGVGTVLLSVKLSNLLFSKNYLKYIFVFLVAINPILIEQSIEARPYALFIFLFTLSLITFYKFYNYYKIELLSKRTFFFFGTILLLVATHHIGFIVLFVYLLIITFKFRIEVYKLIPVGLIYLPNLFLIYFQNSKITGPGWLVFEPYRDLLFYTPQLLSSSPLYDDKIFIYVLQNIVVFGFLALIIWSIVKKRKEHDRNLFLILLVANIVLIWVVSFAFPMYFLRYFTYLIVLTLLIFVYVLPQQRFITFSITALLVILYAVQLNNFLILSNPKPDYIDAITQIDQSTPIYHLSPLTFHSFEYYDVESKIIGEVSDFPYYTGTAVLKDENFTDEITDEELYLIYFDDSEFNRLNDEFNIEKWYNIKEDYYFNGLKITLLEKAK